MKREIQTKYDKIESQKRLYRKRLAKSGVSKGILGDLAGHSQRKKDIASMKKLESSQVRQGVKQKVTIIPKWDAKKKKK